MNKILQLSLLLGSILVLVFVIKNVLKNKISIRYAIIWILWGISMVIISAFPNIIYKLSYLMGIETPSNAVFLIMMFLLYCLTFYIYFIISRHNEDIINLDYEIAVLKKKVEELEKERHNDQNVSNCSSLLQRRGSTTRY